jgi:outer membrane lipoprotein-sorting protein
MQPALFRFSKKTLLLVGYQVGSSDDNPAVAVDITYRSVNKPLPRGTFTFVPPPGVEVKDTTAELVAQAKSNRHARRGRP